MATSIDRSQHHQFYLILYTQTDAQKNGYLCGGGLDLGLNEAGIEEARKIARRFKRNPLKIKKMISGPELRCIQMADALHDEMKAKLILNQQFADQFMGEWEGKPLFPDQDFSQPPRGESDRDFTERVHAGLNALLNETELCLCITHERVARKIFEAVGLGAEKIEAGILYGVDLPANGGIAHFRKV